MIANMKKQTALLLSGAIWLGIGGMLLYKGLKFLTAIAEQGREQGALALIAIGLIIGFIKGRVVLSRVVNRVKSMSEPIAFGELFNLRYLILIGTMMLIGVAMRFVRIDIRGTVDVAIGAALINGAMLYIRSTYGMGSRAKSQKSGRAAQEEPLESTDV